MGMMPAADDKGVGVPTLIVIISLFAFIAVNPFVQSF
jgi:hypothetical protein